MCNIHVNIFGVEVAVHLNNGQMHTEKQNCKLSPFELGLKYLMSELTCSASITRTSLGVHLVNNGNKV